MYYICKAIEKSSAAYESVAFKKSNWRDGRVVDYSGLENRRTERYRGFESLSLRKTN